MIPTLILLSVLVIAPCDIADYFFDKKFEQLLALLKLNQLLLMSSHWLFSTQYFKTSLIFPLIFTMVDLENSFDPNAEQSSHVHRINTSKIESKLFEHGF